MNHLQKVTLLGIQAIIICSCSSGLKTKEFNTSADPQTEINRVDSNLNQAQLNQINILSPEYFSKAKSARDQAVKLRAENKPQKDVLHQLAVSQANLDKANQVGEVSNIILKGPITARQDALNAKAYNFFPKEFGQADNNFKTLTEQVEDNDTANVERRRDQIEAKYRELELDSIIKDKLGQAHATIQEAIKEGGSKLTPETLTSTSKVYSDSQAIIVNQRHDVAAINKASMDANAAANRLLKMVRNAKGSSTKKPEELAKQMEANEIVASQAQQELTKRSLALSKVESNLKTTEDQKNNLESKMKIDNEFEIDRKEFNTNEAEVVKQGNKLLLRLKGLSFANNKSEINNNNFSLLAKVQKVLKDIEVNQVMIEGHTDSLGDKKLNNELSVKRAESVLAYLVANNAIQADKVSTAGYGDTKPIATNKTSEGRSQNRRVDIIISTEDKE